jgi:hypothetical protein
MIVGVDDADYNGKVALNALYPFDEQSVKNTYNVRKV